MWRTMLFVDNLIGGGNQECLSWGWYMQNDMQIFILSMFGLFLFSLNKKIGLALFWIVSFGALIYTFVMMQIHNYPNLARLADFMAWN